MKADANNIRSWRLEIQLETEVETELNKAIDKATENDTCNGISINGDTVTSIVLSSFVNFFI